VATYPRSIADLAHFAVCPNGDKPAFQIAEVNQ
jgi:hypothetical protein